MFTSLVVEGNIDFREMLCAMLRVEFPAMQVVEAVSAEVALYKAAKRTPDLAIVDITLPGASGLELSGMLRTRYPDIIIVVLTSYGAPEYRDAAARHKVDHFLVKGSATRFEVVDLVKSIVASRLTD